MGGGVSGGRSGPCLLWLFSCGIVVVVVVGDILDWGPLGLGTGDR